MNHQEQIDQSYAQDPPLGRSALLDRCNPIASDVLISSQFQRMMDDTPLDLQKSYRTCVPDDPYGQRSTWSVTFAELLNIYAKRSRMLKKIPTKPLVVDILPEDPPLGRSAVTDMRKPVAIGVIKSVDEKDPSGRFAVRDMHQAVGVIESVDKKDPSGAT